MSEAFTVRIEWLDAPGVSTPELAATWARYEIWVAGSCVTQVEDSDGTFRRSVYGSLYPLAEWVAANWWVLGHDLRPSAVESRYWTWPSVRAQPWLVQHNLRGAGDGMAWPNLTLVPEGDITRAVWAPDRDRTLGPVRFVSVGEAWARSGDVTEGLARLVDHVLDRLVEAGLPETRLSDEWAAVATTDDDEGAFCRIVARLGLDPYAVDEETAADVLRVVERLPAELVDDFFDNADPRALRRAAEWTLQAVDTATEVAAKARNPLQPLYEATQYGATQHAETAGAGSGPSVGGERPWTTGYRMARLVRQALELPSVDPFDVSPWLGKAAPVPVDSGGIQGVVAVAAGRCGLRQGSIRSRFGEARALGRVLTRPRQQSFVLSAARGYDERVAGAFAAELLAPADGIRQALDALGGRLDDAALDAVAGRFDVSPLVIRHQYDNQLAEIPGVAFPS
jgi:hypothetical protein